jgi:hypothetical protein
MFSRLGVFAAIDRVACVRLVGTAGGGVHVTADLLFGPALIARLRFVCFFLVLSDRCLIVTRRLIALLSGVTLVRELSAGFLLRFDSRGVRLGCLFRGVRVA